ncbi:hypothetical protein [Winogradskyella bathintestinalis]|uniref:FUSC family protein n=1 Tax=Winogradskyella bathintestinalis TaxID=3035208 RepID=A0ABT7ZSV4_9FLAO|nr:hypothetical protein [Winogradskyella bathintestinalis]MDN3492077.1 hypothetical protein [Winogradskyella bathintestinalis]
MKKVLIVIGLISAFAATILSVTKFFNLAISPIIIAFICGLILLFLSKKDQQKTKPVQYIFLLVIMSLGFIVFKGFIYTPEVDTTEQPKQTEQNDTNGDETYNDSKEMKEEL